MIYRFTLYVGAFFALAVPAWAKTAEEITKDWQEHFENLKSLSYEQEVTLSLPDQNRPLIYRVKLVKEGEKYRSEVNLPQSAEPLNFLGSAFDGTRYEAMSKSGDTVRLNRWTSYRKDENPYQFASPLVLQYNFAFEKGDVLSIETLQRSETWARVLKNIRSVEPAFKDGRKGSMLSIDDLNNEKPFPQSYKVFVDEETGVPLHWEILENQAEARVMGELTVSDFKQITRRGVFYAFPQIPDKSFTFPVRMETSSISNGQTDKMTFSTNTQSLKINEPVVEEFFFPIVLTQQTHFVDEDEIDLQIRMREKRN